MAAPLGPKVPEVTEHSVPVSDGSPTPEQEAALMNALHANRQQLHSVKNEDKIKKAIEKLGGGDSALDSVIAFFAKGVEHIKNFISMIHTIFTTPNNPIDPEALQRDRERNALQDKARTEKKTAVDSAYEKGIEPGLVKDTNELFKHGLAQKQFTEFKDIWEVRFNEEPLKEMIGRFGSHGNPDEILIIMNPNKNTEGAFADILLKKGSGKDAYLEHHKLMVRCESKEPLSFSYSLKLIENLHPGEDKKAEWKATPLESDEKVNKSLVKLLSTYFNYQEGEAIKEKNNLPQGEKPGVSEKLIAP